MFAVLCAALLQGMPVERFVLDNGLTVLLAEDHRAPLVSVGVMYAVGARNETAGITGLAHYAEHMNFRATAAFPGTEITEAITRIGGRWNGYTWIDQTWYVETVARDAFEKMLDLERDRMTSALYDPEDFRKERTSVIAELHSYDDPHSVLYDAVLAASLRDPPLPQQHHRVPERRAGGDARPGVRASTGATTIRTTPSSPSSATSTPPPRDARSAPASARCRPAASPRPSSPSSRRRPASAA